MKKILLILTLLISLNVSAMIPVIDAGNITATNTSSAQQIVQIGLEIQQLKQTYDFMHQDHFGTHYNSFHVNNSLNNSNWNDYFSKTSLSQLEHDLGLDANTTFAGQTLAYIYGVDQKGYELSHNNLNNINEYQEVINSPDKSQIEKQNLTNSMLLQSLKQQNEIAQQEDLRRMVQAKQEAQAEKKRHDQAQYVLYGGQ